MISVVLCKVSYPAREQQNRYDGKFLFAQCSRINDGATITIYLGDVLRGSLMSRSFTALIFYFFCTKIT